MSNGKSNGYYYEMKDEEKEGIANSFAKGDLEDIIETCAAVAMVASFDTWRVAEEYLKKVGFEKFFRSCSNCGYTFECTPECALGECGDYYEKWLPMTKDDEKRLQKLQERY